MARATPHKPCLIVAGSREARDLALALPEARIVEDVPERLTGHAVIDASHPCERDTHARLSHLCAVQDVPLLRYARPGWTAQGADDWRIVADGAEARAALDPSWQRVFLCLGRGERAVFAGDPHRHYLVRTRHDDPAAEGLLDFTLTAKAGPFTARAEAELMRAGRIDALVTRDAGGAGAYPKIEGARLLGVPVVLIARPVVACPVARTIGEVQSWLASL